MGGMGGIQAKAILTGVSARTYFMTLLLAAIGAFFGYLLASTLGFQQRVHRGLEVGSPHARLRAHAA